eukprot:514416-Pyramimonas_sp.AAC.1
MKAIQDAELFFATHASAAEPDGPTRPRQFLGFLGDAAQSTEALAATTLALLVRNEGGLVICGDENQLNPAV